MEIMDESGRWTSKLGITLSRRFDQGRQPRRKYARWRDPNGATICADARKIRQSEIGDRVARGKQRRVLYHLGLLKHEDVWGNGVRIRVTKVAAAASGKKKSTTLLSGPKMPLAAYRRPIVDRRGRVAVFMRCRYAGFRSKGWKPGMAAEHVRYMLREDAVEADAMREGIISNIGSDAAEIAEGFDAIEQVEKAYRANAIVQNKMTVNLPYQLSPHGRERVLKRFCERAFERRGLPYVAAPHVPDPGGDRRNLHGHVAYSTRPMERIGQGEWVIAEEKVNGVTDPAGLLEMRALFAAILNQECRREGLEIRFTHQSYSRRGIDAKRQEHLGPQLTALHRQGETVDMVVRNEETARTNETKQEINSTKEEAVRNRRLFELIERQLSLLDRRRDVERRRERIRSHLGHEQASGKLVQQQDQPGVSSKSFEDVESGRAEMLSSVKGSNTFARRGHDGPTAPSSPSETRESLGAEAPNNLHRDSTLGTAEDMPELRKVSAGQALSDYEQQALEAFLTMISKGAPGLAQLRSLDRERQQLLLDWEHRPEIKKAWLLRPRQIQDASLTISDVLGSTAGKQWEASPAETLGETERSSAPVPRIPPTGFER